MNRVTSYLPAAIRLLLLVVIQVSAIGEEEVPQKVSVGDAVVLHYVERGEGEPIIFVHGLTGDFSVWLDEVDAFAGEGYRAITYSRRYNYPNENQVLPNHSATVEAKDLAAFIRKLGLKNAHIVGHSFGGYTALMLALQDPGLVRTLTLAEPPLAPWLSSLPGDQAKAGQEQSKKLLREGVFPARAAFERGDDELALRTMFDAIAGKGVFETIPEDVQDRCRRNIKEMKAVMTSKSAYPFVPRDKVRGLTVPTLLLSGSASVATAKFTDPELERLLPEASRKRVVLKGATHNMWVDKPEECRSAVLDLIREK